MKNRVVYISSIFLVIESVTILIIGSQRTKINSSLYDILLIVGMIVILVTLIVAMYKILKKHTNIN